VEALGKQLLEEKQSIQNSTLTRKWLVLIITSQFN